MIDNLPQHIFRTSLVLLFVVIFFEITPVDMWLEQGFYSKGITHWVIGHDAEPWRTLLYTGIKKVFISLTVMLLLMVTILHRRFEWASANRRELAVVLLTMVLVPLIVNFLKWYTDIPCPRDIEAFGGFAPYVTLFEHYPSSFHHESSLRCYPAGHASGGFALMSLYFLFKQQRSRWLGMGIGFATGWITGLYKMAIGDHFLSHTVVSMLLAWLVACALAHVMLARQTACRAVEDHDAT